MLFQNVGGGGNLPPFKVWRTFSVFKRTEGDIITLGLTGKEAMSNPKYAAKMVLEATTFAQEKRGAELIGLTSLTSSVTMQGKWLKEQKEVKAALTHGDTYAAAISVAGLEMIAQKTKRSLKEMTVAILGAYGLIGRALAMKLADMCYELILIGPNPNKLDHLCHNLPNGRAKIIKSNKIDCIGKADIIVTATSNPDVLITPDIFPAKNTKTVIYEVSVPPNLPKTVYLEIKKQCQNIIKIDGAMVSLPGIDLGGTIAEVMPKTIYACWAETIMQALEDDKADHIGEIDLKHVGKTLTWGEKYGFAHARFSCFGELIPDDVFNS